MGSECFILIFEHFNKNESERSVSNTDNLILYIIAPKIFRTLMQ